MAAPALNPQPLPQALAAHADLFRVGAGGASPVAPASKVTPGGSKKPTFSESLSRSSRADRANTGAEPAQPTRDRPADTSADRTFETAPAPDRGRAAFATEQQRGSSADQSERDAATEHADAAPQAQAADDSTPPVAEAPGGESVPADAPTDGAAESTGVAPSRSVESKPSMVGIQPLGVDVAPKPPDAPEAETSQPASGSVGARTRENTHANSANTEQTGATRILGAPVDAPEQDTPALSLGATDSALEDAEIAAPTTAPVRGAHPDRDANAARSGASDEQRERSVAAPLDRLLQPEARPRREERPTSAAQAATPPEASAKGARTDQARDAASPDAQAAARAAAPETAQGRSDHPSDGRREGGNADGAHAARESRPKSGTKGVFAALETNDWSGRQGLTAPEGADGARPGAAPGIAAPVRTTASPLAAPDSDAVTSTVARGLAAAVNQKGGTIVLRLQPETLGALRIHMEIDRGMVGASIEASTPEARDLLSKSIDTLRSALEAKGLSVDRLRVDLAQQNSNGHGGPGSESRQRSDQPAPRFDERANGFAHDAGEGRSKGWSEDHGRSGAERRSTPQGGAIPGGLVPDDSFTAWLRVGVDALA